MQADDAPGALLAILAPVAVRADGVIDGSPGLVEGVAELLEVAQLDLCVQVRVEESSRGIVFKTNPKKKRDGQRR